jgi:hypothetical protein
MDSKKDIEGLLKKLKESNDNYTIKDMLDELQKQDPKMYNKAWYDAQKKEYGDLSQKVSNQKLSKPSGDTSKIPVLEKGEYKKASPMIKARFDFAGKWGNAYVMDWLGLPDMEKIWASPKMMKDIATLKENWESSAPAEYDYKDLSLFGYDKDEKDMIFLVWTGVEEPEIWFYSGQNFKKYKTLADFLKFITN